MKDGVTIPMLARRQYSSAGRARERGVAIVLILAFLVLLTGVIVAFFVRATAERQVSNNVTSQAKADTLARGALDVIVGDLKQEIAVGSTSYPISGTTIYKPKANTYVVPTRNYPGLSTSNDPVPNLIRESGPTNMAVTVNATNVGVGGGSSAASTTTVSANGRKIAPARWNSHYLVPRAIVSGNTTSTSIDSTPVSGFTAPSWIPVTSQGAVALSAPSTAVVGRYAYAVYDEGGTLDANVAGYPTAMTATQLGEKGLLAFADLTQLPAYNPATTPSVPTYLPQTQINNLVGWRNYATAQPGGSLSPGYTFDAAAATRYFNFLLGPAGNFLTVNPTAAGSRTDQRFTSRQALLRFWETLMANANGGTMTDSTHLQDVLLYLGTFSRELNAPSWSPATPSGSTVDYATHSDDQTGSIVNRDIPNVRFPNAGSLTRYRIDGTSYTKAFQAGDSVVQMRFPLGRIAWLNTSAGGTSYSPGPAASIPAAAIKTHFGLAWNTLVATDPHWDYVGNTGTAGSPVSTIETLDQVAQDGREPNFFELLKAGILSGSLGKTAADPTVTPRWKVTVYSWLDTARDDVNVDFQVLRIGANIIDQATPSAIPTEIQFANNETTPPVTVSAFGIKSLPYIAWIPFVNYRPEAYPQRNMFGAYYAFEVWDPHQNATVTLPAGSPTNFRIHPLQGKAALRYNNTTGSYTSLSTTDYITFSRDAASGRTFSDLTLLSTTIASGAANNTCAISQPPISNGTPRATPPTVAEGSPGFVGFNVGVMQDLPDRNITGNTTDQTYSGGVVTDAVPSDWPSFEIQVQDPATGIWHPFQHIDYMLGSDAGGPFPTNSAFQLLSSMIGMYNPDPRTERFGAFGGHGISNEGLVWTGTGAAGATMMYGTGTSTTISGYGGGGPAGATATAPSVIPIPCWRTCASTMRPPSAARELAGSSTMMRTASCARAIAR